MDMHGAFHFRTADGPLPQPPRVELRVMAPPPQAPPAQPELDLGVTPVPLPRIHAWHDARGMTPEQLTERFMLAPPGAKHWLAGRTAKDLTDAELLMAFDANLRWLTKARDPVRVELTVRAICWEMAYRGLTVRAIEKTQRAMDDDAITKVEEAFMDFTHRLSKAAKHAENMAQQVRAASARSGEGLKVFRDAIERMKEK
jgi:hypothetical protein